MKKKIPPTGLAPGGVMREELRGIDTSAIEELVRIKKEEDVLAARLEKMESNKANVSQVVYDRVRKDYETKTHALDSESRPLKEQARREYAKLRVLLDEMKKSLDEARLDKEELEFRKDLGEYDPKAFEERLGECEIRLEERQSALDEADGVRSQFLGAVRSEDDLESTEREISPSRVKTEETLAPPEESKPAPPPPPPSARTPPPPPPGYAPEATAMIAIPEMPPPPPPATPTPEPVGSTVVLAMPRLIAMDGEEQVHEFVLKPGQTSIGRSPKNNIQVPEDGVSRQHAQVIFGNDGYHLKDLGSQNGTSVNGQRVTDHVLVDGDIVQVGTQKFLFRA